MQSYYYNWFVFISKLSNKFCFYIIIFPTLDSSSYSIHKKSNWDVSSRNETHNLLSICMNNKSCILILNPRNLPQVHTILLELIVQYFRNWIPMCTIYQMIKDNYLQFCRYQMCTSKIIWDNITRIQWLGIKIALYTYTLYIIVQLVIIDIQTVLIKRIKSST